LDDEYGQFPSTLQEWDDLLDKSSVLGALLLWETSVEDARYDPLVVGIAARDERAFAALYDRYAARLYRAALGMLGRREDAEDVLQEVFAAVWQSRQRLAHVQDLTAYLFTSLRRAAGRAAARRAHEPHTSEAAIDDEPAVSDTPDRALCDGQQLQQALLALPCEQREVIALKIDGGLTFAEIAQVMDSSANTAASRYRYALEKLRELLQKRVRTGSASTTLGIRGLRASERGGE
jgi:RNA polymerase sigma-70 factor (ECF subfamily)